MSQACVWKLRKGKDHDYFALHCITRTSANYLALLRARATLSSPSPILLFLLEQGLENYGQNLTMLLHGSQAEKGLDTVNGNITPTFYILAWKT